MIVRKTPMNNPTELEIEISKFKDTIYLPLTRGKKLTIDSDIFITTEEQGPTDIYVAGFLANLFKEELLSLVSYEKFYISFDNIYNRLSKFSEDDIYKFIDPNTYEDEVYANYMDGMTCSLVTFKDDTFVYIYNSNRQAFVKLTHSSFVHFIKHNNNLYLIDEATKKITDTSKLITKIVQEVDGETPTIFYSSLFND